MGLGTRAVDRTEGDYPRLVSLDQPLLTTLSTVEDKHRYSQRNVDVINLSNNCFTTLPLDELLPSLPFWYKRFVLEHDVEAEARLRDMGRNREICFASCNGIVHTEAFNRIMQEILKTIQTA